MQAPNLAYLKFRLDAGLILHMNTSDLDIGTLLEQNDSCALTKSDMILDPNNYIGVWRNS